MSGTHRRKHTAFSLSPLHIIGLLLFTGLIYVASLMSTEYRSKAATGLPAFPGAEGFGSDTSGGRGGRVIEVTNLNDSGSGSLRDAVEVQTGPRIVVFRTGGVIHLNDEVSVKNPYLTVAGQTAPGNGITLAGSRFSVKTHDVIVRGMRFRIGDGPGQDPGTRDGFGVSGSDTREVYNVIFDHNSVSWAIDENTSTYDGSSTKNKVHDVTFSWNIISEGLYCSIHPQEPSTCSSSPVKYPHSMGFLVGDYTKNISVHHNIFAGNHGRNPLIHGGTSVELVNNVIYNWGSEATTISDGNGTRQAILANIVGNYYKPTAGSFVRQNNKHGIYVKCSTSPLSKIYVRGNVGPGRLTDTGDEWNAVVFQTGCDLSGIKSASAVVAESGITSISATAAYDKVLSESGSVSPSRDTTDSRVVSNVRNGSQPVTGKWFVDSQSEVGGISDYPAGTPPVDNDHDGIPDAWEQLNGGDLSSSGFAPSGYTWIEEYINLLLPAPFLPSTTTVTPTRVPATPSPTGTPAPIPTPTSSTTDITPPTVTIIQPSDGAQLSNKGNLKITVRAADTSGIARIDIIVDGSLRARCVSVTSCSANLKLNNLTQGFHTITGIATDKAPYPNSGASTITVKI